MLLLARPQMPMFKVPKQREAFWRRDKIAVIEADLCNQNMFCLTAWRVGVIWEAR